MGGTRWTYHSDKLYIADSSGISGISTDTQYRLHYIPHPMPIDLLSVNPRQDIPIEIHNVLVIGATLRALAVARVTPNSAQYGRLEAEYREESALAIRSVTRNTTRPQRIVWDERPMMEPW